MKTKESFKKCA